MSRTTTIAGLALAGFLVSAFYEWQDIYHRFADAVTTLALARSCGAGVAGALAGAVAGLFLARR